MRQMLWTNKHVRALKKSSMHPYESYMREERIPSMETAIRTGDATVSSQSVLMLSLTLLGAPTESYMLF